MPSTDQGVVTEARDVTVRANLVSVRIHVTNTTPLAMAFQTDYFELALPTGQSMYGNQSMGVRVANGNLTQGSGTMARLLAGTDAVVRADFVAPAGVNFLAYRTLTLTFPQIVAGSAGEIFGGGAEGRPGMDTAVGRSITLHPFVLVPTEMAR